MISVSITGTCVQNSRCILWLAHATHKLDALTVQVRGALQVGTLLFGIDRLNVKADCAPKYHREGRYSARHSLLRLLSVRMCIDGMRKNLNKLCCRFLQAVGLRAAEGHLVCCCRA
jgi:hypothetical protein